MTNSISPVAADNLANFRYSSLTMIQAAHNDLLRLQRQNSDVSTFHDAVLEFLHDATATGALLDADIDRNAAQSMLDYWAARLYRFGEEPPDSTLADFDPELAPELPDKRRPYKGLYAFCEDDFDKFFGRTQLIADCVEKLKNHRLLAVVGSSGSGKSSVVRAGLLRVLQSGALPGSENWVYVPTFVPGSEPLAAFEKAMRKLDTHYANDRASNVYDCPIVIVVDQFEEVFTICDDQEERKKFISKLLELIESPHARSNVVLTMRSDFENSIAQYPDLQTRFEEGRVQMVPLSAAELREAIERPAEMVGLRFEAGVVEDLLRKILDEPAGLPLLQFTLLKLWENRNRNRITREIYNKIGGGSEALRTSADALYRNLPDEEQKTTLQRIFLQLVQISDRLEVTSKRIRRISLFQSGEASERVELVLKKLIVAGLLRETPGETLNDAQVEVAHEALVRNWPTLVEWLENKRGAIRQLNELEARVKQWVRLGQGNDGLLRESELYEANRWLESVEAKYLGYEPTLLTFLEASRRAIEEARQEKEAVRRREIEQAHALAQEQAKSASRLRLLVAALMIAVLALLAAAGLFYSGQRTAREESTAAKAARAEAETARDSAEVARDDAEAARIETQRTSNELATAQAVLDNQYQSTRLTFAAQGQIAQAPTTALLLAVEAYSRNKNPFIEQVLRDSLKVFSLDQIPLMGHTGEIKSIQWSPDGQRLITASTDGTAKIWSANGLLQTTLRGHAGFVNSAAWSPSGQEIVTASSDNTAKIWRVDGHPLVTLAGHTNRVSNAQWSPDGQHILTASDDQTAKIWSINGQLQATLLDHTGEVNSAQWSPDGQRIVTASNDGTIKIWSADGQFQRTVVVSLTDITIAIWDPNGQRILTVSEDQTAQIWNLDGQLQATLQGHTDSITSAAWSPDGQHVATSSNDRTARIWNLDGQLQAILPGHTSPITNVTWSPDGQHLATSSNDHIAKIWSLDGRLQSTLQATPQGHTGAVTSVVWSPDGQHVATASSDHTAKIWSPDGQLQANLQGATPATISAQWSKDGQHVLTTASNGNSATIWSNTGQQQVLLQGHTADITSAAWSPDNKHVVTASYDGIAKIWSMDGSPPVVLQGHTLTINSVAWSPDGQRIATASNDHTVKIWSLDGQLQVPIQAHESEVNSVAWSPDSQQLVTASNDRTAKIWSLNGQLEATLQGHSERVMNALWSPDGQHLVTTSNDNTAIIWSSTGQQPVVLPGHTTDITSVAWSPDGQHLVTTSNDNTAIIWSSTGQQKAVLKGHTNAIKSAAWSPDGQRLVTTSFDGTAKIWGTDNQLQATLPIDSSPVKGAAWSPDGKWIMITTDSGRVEIHHSNIDDVFAIAACSIERGFTLEEIDRFDITKPLYFDIQKRQCSP